MENKMSNLWKTLLPTMAVFALQNFISLVAMFLLFAIQAHEYTTGSYMDFLNNFFETTSSSDFLVGTLAAYAATGIILLGFWYLKKGKDKTKTRPALLPLKSHPVFYIAGVLVLSVGMLYLSTYGVEILSIFWPSLSENYADLMENIGLDGDYSALLLVYTAILGPICEEITFRGLTFSYAKKVMPFWSANIVQALLFAGFHMNMTQAIWAFFIGLAFGYFVEKSGNLFTGILLHICFNAYSLVVGVSIFGEGPAGLFATLFFAMAATYIGIVVLKRAMPQEVAEKKTEENDETK